MRRPRRSLSVDSFLERRRHTRRVAALAVAVTIGVLVVADQQGWLFFTEVMNLSPAERASLDDMTRYDGRSVRVVEVTDGDTLVVDLRDRDGEPTRVRLWGVDTPEIGRELTPGEVEPAEPFADQAHTRAAALARDRTVQLRLVPYRTRGYYGRILAYVDLPDGTTLNERLLIEGLAKDVTRWPHPHLERYELLRLQAQRDRLGLWAKSSRTR